jgi:hypothetical protein
MSTYDDPHADDTAVHRGAGRAAPRPARAETRDFARTSEFWAVVVTALAIVIAGSVVGANGDNADVFRADKVWLYVTILIAAYVLSRGMAKAGTGSTETDRGPRHDDRSDRVPLADRVKAAAHVLAEGPDDRHATRTPDEHDTVGTPPRRL